MSALPLGAAHLLEFLRASTLQEVAVLVLVLVLLGRLQLTAELRAASLRPSPR
jgi:hypothetical protein